MDADLQLTAMELCALNVAEEALLACDDLLIADYTEYLGGYQRHADDKTVEFYLTIELVEGKPLGFQAWLFDRIIVGRRCDGSLWVIDGGHRLKIARREGIKQVPAWVIPSSGPEFEAKVFKLKNKLTRKNQSAADEIRSECVGGFDPSYRETRDIVTSAGYNWWIANADKKHWADASKPSIKLTKALVKSASTGKLGDALSLFRRSGWAARDAKMSSKNQQIKTEYIHGFCLFLAAGGYRDDQLFNVMQNTLPTSVYDWVTAAELRGGGRAKKLANAFQKLYDNTK